MKIIDRVPLTVLLKNKSPLDQMDLPQARVLMQKRPHCGVSKSGNARVRRNLHTSIRAIELALGFALLLCLSSTHGWAQQKDQQQAQQKDEQQMRGLDDQVQDVKSDVLSIAQELNRLEEKLLYPSGTQISIFVAVAKGDQMRLDAVRLQIDGQLVAHHIYSFKELEALRKGGVQRLYIGNVPTGDHKLEVLVDGKLEGGADFSRSESFNFSKEVKPKLLGLTLAGPSSGNTSITLGEW